MDELYDNLDNYEDLNIIEQLKNENMELKKKLEEYTTAMDKLQKDFDRVSSDFKKMEMNYSSLLKTARVEIERKTKIIKDLNVEKDMIVIKALQDKNPKSIRNIRDLTQPFHKGPVKDSNFGKKATPQNTDNLKAKCDPGIVARKEESRFSSVDTVTSSNTDIASRLLKLTGVNTESVDLWSDRTSDTKENVAKKDVDNSSSRNTRAASIRNRRKSMPAARTQAKFSSDEECEDTYNNKTDTYKKCFPSRDDNTRQNVDKVYNDRYRYKGLEERNKVSETSSADDRYSGYEASRDPYHRNRNDKYRIENHRGSNRFDNNQRHRRYVSPERSRWNMRTEEYFQRHEYGRHRYLESPPPDKFRPYHLRNQGRSKQDRGDLFDGDRRDRPQERYPSKHKMAGEQYEEPSSKRKRADSFSKFPEDEKRWLQDKGVPLEKSVSDLLEEMPRYTTCQSPDDYLLSDDSSPQPVKEIMNTAATPLEDPRTKSKKYVLKNVDDNVELTTVTGRNVDLKMVDLDLWAKNKVNVPKALTRRPSQCSDEVVNQIYMDIDNPVSNMSLESGEILTCHEGGLNKIDSNRHENLPSCSITSELTVRDRVDDKIQSITDSTAKSSYRIPKMNNTDPDKPVPSIVTSKINDKKRLSTIKLIPDDKNRHIADRSKLESDLDKDKLNITKEKDYTDSKISKDKSSHSSLKKMSTVSIMAAKQIIEGDLELSDETCDNTDLQEKPTDEVITRLTEFRNVTGDRESKKLVENKVKDAKTSGKDSETKITMVKDENKKQRSKKKSLKAIETDKIDVKQTKDVKEKAKTDKKSKFNELFGADSNSVITPEDSGSNSLLTLQDLGICTDVQVEQQSITAKYLPICEDAQDAVDINVPEATKVQTLPVLETSKPTEIVETTLNKSEKHPKSKSKAVAETKKRKAKKSDSDCVVAEDVPTPQISKPDQNLIGGIPVADVAAISPIEPLPKIGSQASEDVRIQEHLRDKVNVAKSVISKSEGLCALATSTPHKVMEQGNPDVRVADSFADPNGSSHGLAASVESPADASSTHDVQDSQKEADVPDVRIFVKRRRRVLKKP